MTTNDEVALFVDAYDRAAAPGMERNSVRDISAECNAVRTERHLAGVLHVQVQQFFLGLEAALHARISGHVEQGRLLQLGLAAALEVGLESDEGSPEFFDLFVFMSKLSAYPFDARYGAGFASDGSVSILTGPDLPAFPELGITGTYEHDESDLRRALAVARRCTHLVAEIKARLDWGVCPDGDEPPAAAVAPNTSDDEGAAFLSMLSLTASRHFSVWYGGSESEWAWFALRVLADKGLISAATEEDRAHSIGRAMALWAMHLEFTARSGEGSPGDWTYSVGDWVNDGVDEDQLRLLNDICDLGWDFSDEGTDEEHEVEEVPLSEVCVDVVHAHQEEVMTALSAELGDNFFFASMWATRMDDVIYPLDGDLVYDITNTGADGYKADAYMWFADGMAL